MWRGQRGLHFHNDVSTQLKDDLSPPPHLQDAPRVLEMEPGVNQKAKGSKEDVSSMSTSPSLEDITRGASSKKCYS